MCWTLHSARVEPPVSSSCANALRHLLSNALRHLLPSAKFPPVIVRVRWLLCWPRALARIVYDVMSPPSRIPITARAPFFLGRPQCPYPTSARLSGAPLSRSRDARFDACRPSRALKDRPRLTWTLDICERIVQSTTAQRGAPRLGVLR